MRIFIFVLMAATVLGGFVGAEWSERTFSLTGAVVGGVGVAGVLFGLGAFFDAQERKRKTTLPPEIRAVFDRMVGGPISPSNRRVAAGRSSPDRRAPGMSSAPPAEDDSKFFFSVVLNLLTLQLLPKYPTPKASFASVMTNRRAAGYLFGFHDALLQRLGLRDPAMKERSAALILASYRRLFGDQAGFVLYSRSVSWQSDLAFHEGRMTGGTEIVEYLDAKVPPFGLSRMLFLETDT